MKRRAKNMSFEESLAELEKVVQNLEEGDLPLEVALEKFSEGIQYSKTCFMKLNDAEEKINVVLREQRGQLIENKLNIEEEPSC